MIIGEAPGHREDDSGKPFVGRSGQLLEATLERVGLMRQDVYISNAVHCRPPDNRTPKKKEIEACKHWLDAELAAVKPKFVLLLGATALYAVLGLTGINKLRGRPIEKDGVIYLPTYHPAFVLRGEHSDRNSPKPKFEADLRRFAEMIQFGGVPFERRTQSTIINTYADVEMMLWALRGVVSFDIETTGLYPWADDAAVVTFGFGTDKGEFSIFANHKESPWSHKDITKILHLAFDKIADAAVLVTHNGKFDMLWVRVHYGLTPPIDFDTMMAHYLVDENSLHGLDHLATLYFGAPDWDIPLSEKQGGAPAERIARYHAHDLFYTRELYFKLKPLLRSDSQLWKLYTLMVVPLINLFVQMEINGCYINISQMDAAEEYLSEEIDKAQHALAKWGSINWSSPKQVGELLYGKLKIKCPIKTDKGANSTAESALNRIDHPAVDALKRLRGANQQKSFFIDGWKPWIHDRRLHPSFKLHGTVTGRASAEHPNLQQTPRDTRIRSLITAPPGWTLWEADLSQIELRIAAELSRDPAMLDAFRQGIDIHWLTAMREIERGAGLGDLVIETAKVLTQRKTISYGDGIQVLLEAGVDACEEVNKSWKEYRKKAKAVNFGYIYSMGANKFRKYAKDNYGLDLTDREAQASRTAFFQLYAKLPAWHDNQRDYARKRGFVRTLSGQKRRLPKALGRDDGSYEYGEALRQAINSPVQGFACHLNYMVLLQLTEEFPWSVFRPIATVHDAILAEVRDDWAARVSLRAQEIMRHPSLLDALSIHLTVPIEGEVKLGAWGTGVSLAKWEKK